MTSTLIGNTLKAWHFLYKRGFIEGFGHISARLPDSDQFIIARHSLGPKATAEDFLVLDLEGRKISGKGDIPGEYPIHLDIFRARPDVGSIIHYHGMYSTAFTTSEQMLRPIHLMGTIFHDGVPIYPDPNAGKRWPRRSDRIGRFCCGRTALRLPAAVSRKQWAAHFCSRRTHIAPASAPGLANRSGSTSRRLPMLARSCSRTAGRFAAYGRWLKATRKNER